MKRIQLQLQMLVMLTASLLALALIVVLFFWPSNVAAFLVTPDAGLQKHVTAGPGELLERQFVDVTERARLSYRHRVGGALSDIRQVMSPGVCAADFNGDGQIDVFIPGSQPGTDVAGIPESTPSALFINLGGMEFSEFRDAGRPWSNENAMGCVAADVDNDGDTDLYVTALGPNRLYINDGTGRFEERGAEAGVADPRWSTGAACADYDRDGWLDLFVANYIRFEPERVAAYAGVPSDRGEPAAFSPFVFEAEGDALFRNRGDGTFEDVTKAAGISRNAGKGMGVVFTDLDDDHWPDIVVINDVSANQFYHNTGGRFQDASVLSGMADPRSGMGVAVGDFDMDGLFDLFSSHWQDESNVLYQNLGVLREGEPPFFDDVTIATRLGARSIGLTGWGSILADLDHDADLDLVVVNGYTSPSPSDPSQCIGQPAMLFLQKNGRFEHIANRSGLETLDPYAARGAAAADFDDDGDLDIVVTTNNGPVRIFENRHAPGHFLKVRPLGQAIGCVITARVGTETQRRVILAGTSYLSSEPPEAHFGFGPTRVIDEVRVRWTDGSSARHADVAADQTLIIGPE